MQVVPEHIPDLEYNLEKNTLASPSAYLSQGSLEQATDTQKGLHQVKADKNTYAFFANEFGYLILEFAVPDADCILYRVIQKDSYRIEGMGKIKKK
jgi:hypothetical protein